MSAAMNEHPNAMRPLRHSHVFLGDAHAENTRRTWMVICLCAAMMIAEIVGGALFGSIALVADGMHMSTHAGALLLAALAYSYARKHADDPRFTFGTGKLGDLAGFASAVILGMIALLIGYEAISRILEPVPIHFAEAIPIAVAGLGVNVASAWLLMGDHSHSHGHGGAHEDETHRIESVTGILTLSIFEDGVPPRFRLSGEFGTAPAAHSVTIETVRPSGTRQLFTMTDRGGWLESAEAIPEPHEFAARLQIENETNEVRFEETAHGTAHRDNNMRAAFVHVIADAAVSVLVIAGLLLARAFGWLWMDPLAGIVGACVIASWARGLIWATGAILLDMNPDRRVADNVRQVIESEGDTIADLHLWRLGPGHLGAIVSVGTKEPRGPEHYRERLARFHTLSHLTIEVQRV
jgi:cation diffusion facilitator family transporter